MSKEILRKVNVEVSNDCWKKIKIISVQREISFGELVREILEKQVNNKKYESYTTEET